jgi:hypothetical protein
MTTTERGQAIRQVFCAIANSSSLLDVQDYQIALDFRAVHALHETGHSATAPPANQPRRAKTKTPTENQRAASTMPDTAPDTMVENVEGQPR